MIYFSYFPFFFYLPYLQLSGSSVHIKFLNIYPRLPFVFSVVFNFQVLLFNIYFFFLGSSCSFSFIDLLSNFQVYSPLHCKPSKLIHFYSFLFRAFSYLLSPFFYPPFRIISSTLPLTSWKSDVSFSLSLPKFPILNYCNFSSLSSLFHPPPVELSGTFTLTTYL